MEKGTIVFASGNQGKVDQVKDLLGDFFNILSLKDIGCDFDIPETFPTLVGNAYLKAKYVFDNYPEYDLIISDDSGLFVKALDGDPGVLSARYAGEHKSDEDNMDKLLSALGDEYIRQATYVSVICFIDRKMPVLENTKYFYGTLNGEISLEKRGTNGFGYDKVFIPNAEKIPNDENDYTNKTLAEMPIKAINWLSHRTKALTEFGNFLNNLDGHNFI